MKSMTYHEDKILNKTFISIFIANSLMNLSQQMTNSLVSKYAHHLGATATTIGIVVSMFTYTAIGFKLISAPALDAFNRKYILMGAMLTMALAYLGYGISNGIPVLMGARLLQGAGQAFTATGSLALATDALPKNKLGSGLGLFSMAQAVCQAIGPSIGLFLVSMLGYNVTFFIGSASMLFAALITLRIKAVNHVKRTFKINFKNIIAKEALLPAGIMMLLSTAYCAVGSFLIIYATNMGVESIGLFFTVYAATMLFTRPIIGKLSDKIGVWRVLLPALLCFSFAFLIISVANNIYMFLLAAFVSAFGYGACQPAIQTLCMKAVTAERRGAASCTNYIGMDLGNLIGPILAGMAVETFGYSQMWRLMLIPVILAFIIILGSKKAIERIENNYL